MNTYFWDDFQKSVGQLVYCADIWVLFLAMSLPVYHSSD